MGEFRGAGPVGTYNVAPDAWKKRTRETTAELVGYYFGLQRAGNMNVPGDGATINRLRDLIDAAKKEVEAKLPPGTIDAWPREPNK